jgi:uncharacterized membrane protein YbhN (UPF0104 family)
VSEAARASSSTAGTTGRRSPLGYTLLLALKVGISAGLITWLLRSIDLRVMLGYFRDLRWDWMVLALVLHQMQGVISALKWQMILAADGQRFRLFFLFKTYQIGNFLSLFMPTSFGGDVYRTWALNRTGVKFSKSTASVLFDRLSGLFALLSIGVAGSVLLLPALAATAVVAGYTLGALGFLVVTGDQVVTRLPQPSGKYRGFPFRVLRSFNTYRHRRAAFFKTLLLSGAFQFNVVLIVWCYARSLHVSSSEISFAEMVAVVPVIFLSEVLPAINGIGVRDGAFVFFFGLVGSTAEKAMAVSIMVLLIRYLKSFVVGALWMGEIFRRPAERPAESEAISPLPAVPPRAPLTGGSGG